MHLALRRPLAQVPQISKRWVARLLPGHVEVAQGNTTATRAMCQINCLHFTPSPVRGRGKVQNRFHVGSHYLIQHSLGDAGGHAMTQTRCLLHERLWRSFRVINWNLDPADMLADFLLIIVEQATTEI